MVIPSYYEEREWLLVHFTVRMSGVFFLKKNNCMVLKHLYKFIGTQIAELWYLGLSLFFNGFWFELSSFQFFVFKFVLDM